jgi:hypothetical protein
MPSRRAHLKVCVLVLLIEFRVTLLFPSEPLVNDETRREGVSSVLDEQKGRLPVLLTAVDAVYYVLSCKIEQCVVKSSKKQMFKLQSVGYK